MTHTTSTRRRFFTAAGAALSAPLAIAAPAANAGDAARTLGERLAAAEDRAALRELSHAYARHVNARARAPLDALFADGAANRAQAGLSRVSIEDFDALAQIEIATDRRTATVRVPCRIEIEAAIDAPGWTLVDMARAQGEGIVKRTEPRILEQACVRGREGWKIELARLAPAGA